MQEPLIDTLQTQLCEDTVLTVTEAPVVSIFQGHQLQVENGFSYLERVVSSGSFGFIILFVCAAIIVYLQRNSDGIFSAIVKASFDINQASQDARVENSQRNRNMLIIQIMSVVSIGLFLAVALPHFMTNQYSTIDLFFPVITILVLTILLRRLSLWFLAQLFDLNNEFRFHRFNLSVFFSISGLMLLPLSLVLLYSPQIPASIILYLGGAVALFFYLKGLQRGVAIAISSSSISALHLFYYFCALEILPIFVLLRFALQR